MWQEITISNQQEKISATDTLALKRKEKINRDDLIVLKNKIRSQFDSKIQLYFQPVDFLEVTLTGSLHLRISLPEEIMALYSPQNPIYDDILTNLCGKVLKFYEEDFVDDTDLLDILSSYFLTRNRFEDYKNIALRYLHNRSLPLKHELFLILLGIQKLDGSSSISLPDHSSNPLIILFKYRFFSLTEKEKTYLYDLLMTGRYDNLLPIALEAELQQDPIRNLFPIYQRIIDQFSEYNREEKVKFIEYYRTTGKYLSLYFLMKSVYSKESIEKWLQEQKKQHGKYSLAETSIPLNQTGAIRNKLKQLTEQKQVYLLQPFELLLLLNTTESFMIRDRLEQALANIPGSYIVNRAMAVVAFFDNEYFQFFQYINRSGRFRYQAEILYIKAVSLYELGKKEEGVVILQALQKKFPQSQFLNKALQEYHFNL